MPGPEQAFGCLTQTYRHRMQALPGLFFQVLLTARQEVLVPALTVFSI